MSGLNYIHEKGIAHRDLKLQNILLDEDCKIKIMDFGFAQSIDEKKPGDDKIRKKTLLDCAGTLSYMSPEIDGVNRYDGVKSDIFAAA